jgi:hypothetical protein
VAYVASVSVDSDVRPAALVQDGDEKPKLAGEREGLLKRKVAQEWVNCHDSVLFAPPSPATGRSYSMGVCRASDFLRFFAWSWGLFATVD